MNMLAGFANAIHVHVYALLYVVSLDETLICNIFGCVHAALFVQ